MKKKPLLLIACAALVAATLCFLLRVSSNGPPEPVYAGKPLGYWLNAVSRANATFDDSKAEEAALRAVGTNAIPFLVARFERQASRDSRKEKFNAFVTKWHLPAGLEFTNTATFHVTAQAMRFGGQSAKAGLMSIFEETSNSNALRVAAQTLYGMEGFGRGSFDRPTISWQQYVMDQKDVMSPAA